MMIDWDWLNNLSEAKTFILRDPRFPKILPDRRKKRLEHWMRPRYFVETIHPEFEKRLDELRLEFMIEFGKPEWGGKLFYDLNEAVDYANKKREKYNGVRILYRYALHNEE